MTSRPPTSWSAPLVAVVLTALTVLSLTVAAPARAATAPDDYVAQVRASTNAERAARQRRPLTTSACLQRIARRQAARMAEQRQISHTAAFGRIGPRCGLASWSENVAQALGRDDGRGVVRMWMASAGHRTNLLAPSSRLIGIGAVHRHGSWWVVQVFGRRL